MMNRGLMALAFALALTGVGRPLAAQDPTDIANGARVWAENCTRCHNARTPTERSDREWLTVAQHMRVRANLTRTQTRLVVVYLQAVNAPEFEPGGAAPTGGSAPASAPQPEDLPLGMEIATRLYQASLVAGR